MDEALVIASGKMQLLDRIMTALKKQGDHKVLIFSQMTRMLDILEDYMTLRGYNYRRLDGGVSAAERAASVSTSSHWRARTAHVRRSLRALCP